MSLIPSVCLSVCSHFFRFGDLKLDVYRLLQWCLMGVSKVFQGSFKLSFKDVLRIFQGCFKDVSVMF